MTDDPRIQQLVDELLGSETTPEAVCSSCPELLPVVRQRWLRVRRLNADLDDLFPPPLDDAPPPPPGADLPLVSGYEVETVLGRGGMGIVYRARHLRLNRLVALKMLLAGAYATPHERARFQREAEDVARLQHPNIVQVHDVGDIAGRSYFTMELLDGGSLAHKLAGAPQPARQAAELVATLAGAVWAAHERGIVHRDLKPANILLTAEGTPKVTDFGLARRQTDGPALTQIGVAIGTPSYMAPEQARGRQDMVGTAADVYALGAILYELLTGRPPFRAATAAETVQQVISQEPVPLCRLNDRVPRDLETICSKCLNKEPTSRYGTAEELAQDLQRYLRGEPIMARPALPAERLLKWARRRRSLAASLVTGILLAIVLAGVGGWVLLERVALQRAVSKDLDKVVSAQNERNYDQARTALERAKGRLGTGGPPKLRRRAEQLERELALVRTLEEIIFTQVTELDSQPVRAQGTARLEAALRAIRFLEGQDAPAVVAARIRATGIPAPILTALDYCADVPQGRDPAPLTWMLEVARLLDEDPASRPLRDGKLWESKPALEAFARSAPLANQSVPFLIFLSRKLNDHGGDTIALLKRVQQAHVASDIANATLANSLLVRGNAAESVRYFQAAVALQPSNPGLRHNFGKALCEVGRCDEAFAELEEASRLSPDSAVYSTAVAAVLNNMQQSAAAERRFRQVLEKHPAYPPCLLGLALSLFQQGRHDEAIETNRRAVAADPTFARAHRMLKENCLTLKRWEEAREAWHEWLTCNSSDLHFWEGRTEFWSDSKPGDHAAWDGYAELCLYLGHQAEFRRARTELLHRFRDVTDPRAAERTGRACLLLPTTDDELLQATALIDRALASQREKPDWLLPYFGFAKALADYRAGRLENARTLLTDKDIRRVLGPGPGLLLAMARHRLGER
ncbi:MAG TPA: serine/threonine-protein kinase, partial [Planctomycetaceae bacterium]